MWVEALEPAEIRELDLSLEVVALEDVALEDNAAFMQAFFELVHQRPETDPRHLTTLGRRNSTERVTLFLAETAALAPTDKPANPSISREGIADHLGFNAETASPIFSRLKTAGLLRFPSPTALEVPDPDTLARRRPAPVPRKPSPPMAAVRTQAPRHDAAPAAGCPAFHRSDTG